MSSKVYNFYAGPGKLPESVLERIKNEMNDFQGTGMSVLEISHRAKPIVDLIERTTNKFKKILELDEEDEVLFLQGGATLQFSMIPLNLSETWDKITYVDTGYWSQKAIDAGNEITRTVDVIKVGDFYIPKTKEIIDKLQSDEDALDSKTKYLHICSNNTVMGTQWFDFPIFKDLPLVVDMSSDILSRKVNIKDFGLVYAHAQKTLGAAGVTVVIIPKKTIGKLEDAYISFLDYKTHIKHKSNYNTPPVFAIYTMDLMLDWLQNDIGGLDKMEEINRTKSKMLYNFLDDSKTFETLVEEPDRSMMNVTFTVDSEMLYDKILKEAEEHNIFGIKGHRSVGGYSFRVSLYNAVSIEDVEYLINFLERYEGVCPYCKSGNYLTYTLEESKTKLGKHHCLNCKEDFIDPVRNNHE